MKLAKDPYSKYISMDKYRLTYIVDDDPIQCFLNKKMLEDMGYFEQIESYPNGKIALDQLTKVVNHSGEMPSLILLDINMPVMDGWGFLDALGQIYFQHLPPIYIITSSIDSRDAERATSYSKLLAGYLVKPITLEKLRSALRF